MKKKLNNLKFNHGINLGGWLSQCYGYEKYDSFITIKDIETIKKLGFDHIRLPIDYNLIQNRDGSFKIEGFYYITKAIKWCKVYGLNIILDLHKTIGYSFDDGEQETGFFENEEYQSFFYSLWEEIIKKYIIYEDILCLELLNEVTSKDYLEPWNRIATTCINRIRAISKNVTILVGSYSYNHVSTVSSLSLPSDKNLMYNFHFYEPLIFTHQGAFWQPSMSKSFRMHFYDTYENYIKYTKENLSEGNDTFSKYNTNEIISESYFEDLMKDALTFAKEKHIQLYCSEYGVIDRSDPKDALIWYSSINKLFEKYKIGRALWTYKSMNFGITDNWISPFKEELIKSLCLFE